MTVKDPNSAPLSSLVHFKMLFDPKWRTCVLHRKQLILLMSSDWLISIQNGEQANCRGNRYFCCCPLIGWFRSKVKNMRTAAVCWLVDFDPKWRLHLQQKSAHFEQFYSVWRNLNTSCPWGYKMTINENFYKQYSWKHKLRCLYG